MLRLTCLTLCLLVSLVGCNNTTRVSREYETVSQELGRNPEAAKYFHQQGLKALDQGKSDEAEAAFKRALEADVNYGPAHNNLGQLYFQQQKLYLAAWEFQYAAKLMPQKAEPLNNLGLVHEQAGQLDQAITCFHDALKLAPENPEIIGNLARTLIRRGDRTQEVRDLLQQLVMRDSRPQWQAWAKEELVRMTNN
ncbi:tetratricopeptide repeat protein [Planctomycetales bacterium ZRK34]|nr:tetratricopeptide repeat protein [Planctomycetales bacterium ZRK34]